MKRISEFNIGVCAALFAVLIWGAQVPVAKAAYEVIDPFTAQAIRYVIASLLLGALLTWRQGLYALRPGAQPVRLAVAGTLGMAGSPLLFFVGLSYTLPEHAVLIAALQPTLTALAQWFLHGKRPPLFSLCAIAVAFCGVVLVVTGAGIGAGNAVLIGDLLVLCSTLCWLSYSMMLSRFPELGPLRFTTLTCAIGTLVILTVTGLALLAGAARLPTTPELVSVAPHLAFLAILGGTVAMLVWNYGNTRIGPVNSILLINLMPVITYGIRYMQGARFGWHEWVGAVLVVGALVANNLYQRRHTVK